MFLSLREPEQFLNQGCRLSGIGFEPRGAESIQDRRSTSAIHASGACRIVLMGIRLKALGDFDKV